MELYNIKKTRKEVNMNTITLLTVLYYVFGIGYFISGIIKNAD